MEDVRLVEKIKAFLDPGSGSGSGSGYGSGSGDGSGYGDGYGSGDGYGYGYGDGYGSGDGYCSGYGDGYGSGYGSGYGYGYGYGYGDGISEINGHRVYRVDGVQTVFTAVKGNVAKGYILQSDLTLTPCYVVKGTIDGTAVFAHGDDLHKAMDALTDKLFEDMPEEERIAEFIKAHPDIDSAYPNQDLFDWHHRLTGSCLAGRNAFIKDRGLTLDGETTVREFIVFTRNAYNGSVIQHLEKAYGGQANEAY